MTNKNTILTGGITVPTMPATNNVVLKQEDLNATLEDAVLTRAEETMMDDEEITSVESNGAMEDTMLTMAMLNSVSDIGGPRGGGEDDGGDSSGEVKDRVRKRRRSDDDEGAGSVPNPLSNPLMSLPTAKVNAPMPILSSIVEQVASSTAGVETETTTLDPIGDPKRKVCFEEPTSRLRGFSIDLELAACALELGDDHISSGGGDAMPEQRPRAFSFECLAFDSTLDEHVVPTSVESDFRRPRGDSIIFDPTSFQDGGIHEQAALWQHSSIVGAVPDAVVSSSSSSATSKNESFTGPKVTAFTANSAVGVSPSGSATLPMDLLNKGGRIGIYLPDARKARIARFHAKRSKRVWRKRIKYDCRKKLADSRPRVKGRFVKRTN